ncbi:MAG: SUMF1/EgtB/PvdO family nonheme iron enzyme [Wenzhouxiangella sp.]
MMYRFGPFELDPRSGVLRGPGGEQTLRRQTCRLLEVLLERAPEVLDRDTLLDLAWGRTALSANVLPQAISELRQALGDQAQSPSYIETLHRRGYRVICPVEKVGGPAATMAPANAESATSVPASPHQQVNRVLLWGTIGLVMVLALVVGLWWQQLASQRWLESEAIPEIRALMEVDLAAAWRKLRKVRARVPDDERLEQMWRDLALPNRLVSEPPGAEVAVRGFRETAADWIVLGHTPLDQVDLPLAMLRFRVRLPGYATIESAPGILPLAETFVLQPEENAPDGMVYVPPGPVSYLDQERTLPGFWIDRYEVTNRQFRRFVEAGGYRQEAFWRYRAEEGGVELSWQEMMDRFVDATGLPGPATWMMGTYPAGQGDHPVSGISWFEAAAYAEFAGRRLPTVFHWRRAAGLGISQMQNFSDMVLASRFNAVTTVPVGSLDSLGSYGTFDMGGNVAEWCYNADGVLRHLLGGHYMEDAYRFADFDARHPLERSPGFGLRLMHADETGPADLGAEVPAPDRSLPEPVDDATFAIYSRLFEYDRRPLDVRVEEVDDSHEGWRRERISFPAAYGQDRVLVQVFIPRHSAPPYQAVVHFPGGDALLLDASRHAGLHHVEPFLRSGRAVVYPVYQGTFERKVTDISGPIGIRQLLVNQVKDLRLTIDYLAERGDIDMDGLLFHGVSYGGNRAPFPLALEDRFRAAIILSGGLGYWQHLPAEIQPQNYLPRVRVPVLMINGAQDYNFPVESAQKPFFDLLGTPPENKTHLILDWGHLPPHYSEVIRAYLEWTERWLGPAAPHP